MQGGNTEIEGKTQRTYFILGTQTHEGQRGVQTET